MIKSEPVPGKDTTVEVNCSRGFRYVRYVGPKSAGSHRPRVTYYGEEGEGDDSQLYQITNLPLIVMHKLQRKQSLLLTGRMLQLNRITIQTLQKKQRLKRL